MSRVLNLNSSVCVWCRGVVTNSIKWYLHDNLVMEFQHYANASWITFCIVWRKWRRGATNSNKDLLKVTGWRIFEILRQKRKNGRDRDAKLVSDSETTTPKTYGLADLEDLDRHGNNSWHLGLLLWVNSFMHSTSSFKILTKRWGKYPRKS